MGNLEYIYDLTGCMENMEELSLYREYNFLKLYLLESTSSFYLKRILIDTYGDCLVEENYFSKEADFGISKGRMVLAGGEEIIDSSKVKLNGNLMKVLQKDLDYGFRVRDEYFTDNLEEAIKSVVGNYRCIEVEG